MQQCDLGYVLYQGYCVPSHFTQTEKDEFVRRKKKARKRLPITLAIMALVTAGLWLFFITS